VLEHVIAAADRGVRVRLLVDDYSNSGHDIVSEALAAHPRIGEPSPEQRDVHEVVRRAQQAGVDAVRPGAACQDVDRAARAVITEAGYGAQFLHRTGHGIGLSVHEEPYIVAGNDLPLTEGMAFSVEPGIYFPGQWGARIEDIVIVTADGAEAVNVRPHELIVVPAGPGATA